MWYLPTRGRSHNLKRFFDAYYATEANSPGLVIINDNDEDFDGYQKVELPAGWELKIFHGEHSIWPKLNTYYMQHQEDNWFGHVEDDLVPQTKNWDKILIETAGLDGFSYPDDGILSGKWGTCWVTGGDLQREKIAEIGGVMLPGIKHLYGDNFNHQYAKRRGVARYCPDVYVEHRHFSNGKAPHDKTYVKTNHQGDKEAYEKWLGYPYVA